MSDPGLTSHPCGSAASSTLSHPGVRQHSDEVMENGRGESGPSLLAAGGKVSVSEAARVAVEGGGAGEVLGYGPLVKMLHPPWLIMLGG